MPAMTAMANLDQIWRDTLAKTKLYSRAGIMSFAPSGPVLARSINDGVRNW